MAGTGGGTPTQPGTRFMGTAQKCFGNIQLLWKSTGHKGSSPAGARNSAAPQYPGRARTSTWAGAGLTDTGLTVVVVLVGGRQLGVIVTLRDCGHRGLLGALHQAIEQQSQPAIGSRLGAEDRLQPRRPVPLSRGKRPREGRPVCPPVDSTCDLRLQSVYCQWARTVCGHAKRVGCWLAGTALRVIALVRPGS